MPILEEQSDLERATNEKDEPCLKQPHNKSFSFEAKGIFTPKEDSKIQFDFRGRPMIYIDTDDSFFN